MRRRAGVLLILCALAGPGRAEDGRALNQEAIERHGKGDLEGALALFRKARALLPEDRTVRENLAKCLISTGDAHRAAKRFADAARDYHEAGGVDPDLPAAPAREGLALLEDKKERDALVVLERAVRRWPDEADAHALLAVAADRTGETARAIAAWERVVALRPTDADARARLEKLRQEEAVERGLGVDLGAAHFTVKYDGAKDLAVGRRIVATLEAAWRDVGQLLGKHPPSEIAVVIYPGRTFQAVTGAHGWVAGLYDGKIRVPADGLARAPDAEVRRVLYHEYCHALVRLLGGPRVPTWLHEGLAQVAEGRTRADARAALPRGAAPGLADLEASFASEADAAKARLRYAAACDLAWELFARGGAPNVTDLLERLRKDEPLDQALRAVYGVGPAELEAAWRGTLPR